MLSSLREQPEEILFSLFSLQTTVSFFNSCNTLSIIGLDLWSSLHLANCGVNPTTQNASQVSLTNSDNVTSLPHPIRLCSQRSLLAPACPHQRLSHSIVQHPLLGHLHLPPLPGSSPCPLLDSQEGGVGVDRPC